MDFARYRVINTQKKEYTFVPSELDRIVEDLQQQNQPSLANFAHSNASSEVISGGKTRFATVFESNPNTSSRMGISVKKQSLFWVHVLAFITCLFSIAALVISLVMNYQIWPWLWSHN